MQVRQKRVCNLPWRHLISICTAVNTTENILNDVNKSKDFYKIMKTTWLKAAST